MPLPNNGSWKHYKKSFNYIDSDGFDLVDEIRFILEINDMIKIKIIKFNRGLLVYEDFAQNKLRHKLNNVNEENN